MFCDNTIDRTKALSTFHGPSSSTALQPISVSPASTTTVMTKDHNVTIPSVDIIASGTDMSAKVSKTGSADRKSFRNGKLAAALLAGRVRRQQKMQDPGNNSAKQLQIPSTAINPVGIDNSIEVVVSNKVSRLPASMTKQLRMTRRKVNIT